MAKPFSAPRDDEVTIAVTGAVGDVGGREEVALPLHGGFGLGGQSFPFPTMGKRLLVEDDGVVGGEVSRLRIGGVSKPQPVEQAEHLRPVDAPGVASHAPEGQIRAIWAFEPNIICIVVISEQGYFCRVGHRGTPGAEGKGRGRMDRGKAGSPRPILPWWFSATR